MKYSLALRNARLQAIITELGASPIMQVYDGTPPPTVDTAVTTQTVLSENVMAAAPFAAPLNGVLTANDIADDITANATGTAAWARLTGASATLDISVGVAGSGAELIVSTTAFVQDVLVSFDSFVITHGNT